MITYCYFRAQWSGSRQTNVDSYFTLKDKNIISINVEKYNLCQYCNQRKFERSSHCRTCNKCVLRRDHHCIWLGNCIGYKNTQYFLNFLFWVIVGIYNYFHALYHFYDNYDNVIQNYPNCNVGKLLYFLIIFISVIYVSIFVGVLSIFIQQLNFIYNDTTLLEKQRNMNLENSFFCLNSCKKQNNKINKYNKGFLSHFYSIVGPTVFHLILPLPKFKKIGN